MRVFENNWLFNTPIAHRGLWGNGVIENSLTAYELAVTKGFPIEIDLFSTKDGHLVSFHDDNLKRLLNENKLIYDCTLSELKEYNLGNGVKIPTFKEVLNVVDGKVPLLIELKNQPCKKIVDLFLEEIKGYNGEFAVQSFNPKYMLQIKKKNPDIIRGVLSSNKPDTNSVIKSWVVRKMPFNRFINPDFISYDYKGLPLKKKNSPPVIAWTVTSSDIFKKIKPYCKNIIFENFLPEI